MLSIVEGEVLGTRVIEDLLALVDRGVVDDSARLVAERDRLRGEVENLVASIAAGVPAGTVADAIRDREAQIAKLEAKLRVPRQAPPNIERLREALSLRAEQWRSDLRSEPQVARLVLRRLVGPIALWEEPRPDYVRWEAPRQPENLLIGLEGERSVLVASPTGFEPVFWP